ncbi:hypothetical protein GCM10022284_38670 [Streptomyces hundungensis]
MWLVAPFPAPPTPFPAVHRVWLVAPFPAPPTPFPAVHRVWLVAPFPAPLKASVLARTRPFSPFG